MAIPKFLQDLSIISKLGDNPGTDNGLSAAGLRAKFDEAGIAVQNYINNTLIPELSGLSNPEEGLNMKNNISMGGHRVTGLGDPQENGDAVSLGFANGKFAPSGLVTKNYVISSSNGTDEEIDNILQAEYDSMANYSERHISIENNKDGLSLPRSTYLICISRTDAGYGTFRAIGYDSLGVNLLSRCRRGGVTQPWEWENPPMELDKEYRTTERWNGNTVYRKIVSHTNSIAYKGNATYEILHGISNLNLNSVEIVMKTSGYPMPYIGADGTTAVRYFDSTKLYLTTSGDVEWSPGRNWYFEMKYTKIG